MIRGNIYRATGLRKIAKTLGSAADLSTRPASCRAAMGDAVIDHHTRATTREIAEQNRMVTDWDVRHGLERAEAGLTCRI